MLCGSVVMWYCIYRMLVSLSLSFLQYFPVYFVPFSSFSSCFFLLIFHLSYLSFYPLFLMSLSFPFSLCSIHLFMCLSIILHITHPPSPLDRFGVAETYMRRAVSLVEEGGVGAAVVPEKWSALLNNLAHTCRKLAKYEEAIHFHQQVRIGGGTQVDN